MLFRSLLNRNILNKEATEEVKFLESRKNQVNKLRIALHEFKSPTSQQINKNTYAATRELAKVVKELNILVKRLEKDISKYPSSTKIVSELKNLDKTVKGIAKK